MNKAFNRKGKLSFKAAYPGQHIVAYFVKKYTSPDINTHSGEIEIYGTCGSTTYWVSDRVPKTNSFDGYSDLDFVEVGALIQPT